MRGDAAYLELAGLIDEQFSGFGTLPDTITTLVVNVQRMARMTSFGVRQWLKAMNSLPKKLSDIVLFGCPTFFVDQLNMVLNFGGSAKVLTIQAPYVCPACGTESSDKSIDVVAERTRLLEGTAPPQTCDKCGAALEFDESPEGYFAFVSRYGATTVSATAADLLEERGLYRAPERQAAEKPPRIVKLVHDSATYFKISGTISKTFRARPLLVGAEGEVVLDLGEVERYGAAGQREWERLIRSLSNQVNAITLIDVGEPILKAAASATFRFTPHFAVASLLLPYACQSCGKQNKESVAIDGQRWPFPLDKRVCPVCAGPTFCELPTGLLGPLTSARTTGIPPASMKVIERRNDLLSRAFVEASVAKAGDVAYGSQDSVLGKYRIVRRVSAGGMAEVFLAKQIGIGGFEKPVALKRILKTMLENRHLAVDLFLNEAKIAARLLHPNIVQVLDVGEERGALYLAMEYVNGRDLRAVIKATRQRGVRTPLPHVLYVLREVANALHHAYWSTDLEGNQLQVVHRDVSPHNVLVSRDGAIKLSDFGVALSSVTTTESEQMVTGKWSFMSPEQTRGERLDHRSDLFSLGIVVYHLATGNLPFPGSNARDVVSALRGGKFIPLRSHVPELPDALDNLISQLLSTNPDKRPPHAQGVANAVNEIARATGCELRGEAMATWLADLFPEQSTRTVTPSASPDKSWSLEVVPQSGSGGGSLAGPTLNEGLSDPGGRGVGSTPPPSVTPGSYSGATPQDSFADEDSLPIEIIDMDGAAADEPPLDTPSPEGPNALRRPRAIFADGGSRATGIATQILIVGGIALVFGVLCVLAYTFLIAR